MNEPNKNIEVRVERTIAASQTEVFGEFSAALRN
jgi:hypothetical protein